MKDKFILLNSKCQDAFYELEQKGIKVDAIITDPPYNVGYHYNTYTDKLSEGEYEMLLGDIDQFAQNNGSRLSIMHYPQQAIKHFTNVYGVPDAVTAWVYNSNTPKQMRLIFNYGEVFRNNVRQPYKNPNDKRIKQRIAEGKVDAKAYDWWNINQVKNVSKTKLGNKHSCPIPLELAIKMILLTTKKGETVLDPFMGSGTMGIACLMTGRKFVGIEMDTEYFAYAKEQLESYKGEKYDIYRSQR